MVQALYKLGEPKAIVKVREADLALIKEVLEPVKAKFTEVMHLAPPSKSHPAINLHLAASRTFMCCVCTRMI